MVFVAIPNFSIFITILSPFWGSVKKINNLKFSGNTALGDRIRLSDDTKIVEIS